MCCSVLQCSAVCCRVLQFCCSVHTMKAIDIEVAGMCLEVCCSVLQCVAVCRSVLQCSAVCCSVLQCGAVLCSVLQFCCSVQTMAAVDIEVVGVYVAVCCSVLQCVAVLLQCSHNGSYRQCSRWCVPCSVWQCVAVCYSVVQLCCSVHTMAAIDIVVAGVCVAVCCSVWQCVAVWCSVVQCVAVLLHFSHNGGYRH